MLRDIIKIDEDKCTGCGLCIPGCPEGAIQLIDGKARLVSDLSCDGLGACLGHCPEGAIEIEKREAEPYNEKAVMANIVKAGANTIAAHLKHLEDHGENEYLAQAHEYLEEHGIEVPAQVQKDGTDEEHGCGGGCPGSRIMQFVKNNDSGRPAASAAAGSVQEQVSELTHWPVQLHLLNPRAPYLKQADLLLSADCVAHSVGNFHSKFLKGKALAVACPKLDSGLDSYVQKLTEMIDGSGINTLTVMMMEVPCCGGLLAIARQAASAASRKIPIKKIVVSIKGELLSEEWV